MSLIEKMDHPCISCGETTFQFLYFAEDHYTEREFSLLQCQQCGLTVTDPHPSIDDFKYYYPPSYYGENGVRFHPILEFIVQQFRRHLAKRISVKFPSGGRILEIGSGRGTLLAVMEEMGWEAIGTEYSDTLAKVVQNKFGIHVFPTPKLQDCKFPNQHFDVIVCYHVLEHLPNPIDTVNEIRRILHPSGLLIIAVPNFGGTVAKLSKEHWFANDVPRHLFHFTPDTLTAILEKSGFSISYKSTLSLEQDIFGFVQSVLNKSGLPNNSFYDFIRNPTAKLRHHNIDKNSIVMLFFNTILLIIGIIISIIALPFVILAAIIGKGGTIEYWANQLSTNE